MALPKEPRQKMINLMYLVLTALLALNVSSEILNAFKVVDRSLMNSSQNLTTANTTLYASLLAKLSEPESKVKAEEWQPLGEKAKALSADMNKYIEDLKGELKKEAGLKMVDGKESFKEDNLEAATRLFAENGKGKELEQRLLAYRKAMLDIHPSIRTQFEKTIPVDLEPQVGQDGKKNTFTNAYFHMTPTVAGLTLLSKFQNNVKNAENQIVTYIHEQIGAVKVKFDKTGVLVGQSSNYVMPGDEISITAGIGAYSSAAQPQISIGGVGQQVIDGSATYKISASGGGLRKVPVTIRYKDQDGNDKVETKEVEYTVGTPGGAAVMLDKMNVFYIGVDNPVTIGSPTGWDKTNVSMSGGSMSGSGSNRTVRVSAIGAANITVTANGKSSSFPFRVKKIPNPVFKVGPGGTRMQSVVFKSQQFCRADLENFDFDVRYSVTSATVYFSGAGFPNVVTATINSNSLASLNSYIQRCQPGSNITFDNVKVSGPDGGRTIQGVGIILQ
ncbi:MAG: gliding motility protein GldM [Ferruginibacter sp.]